MVNEYIKAYVAYLVEHKKRIPTAKLELLEYRAEKLFHQLTRENLPELEKLLPDQAKKLKRILDAQDEEKRYSADLPW